MNFLLMWQFQHFLSITFVNTWQQERAFMSFRADGKVGRGGPAMDCRGALRRHKRQQLALVSQMLVAPDGKHGHLTPRRTEKNATEWSKNTLKKLLAGLEFESAGTIEPPLSLCCAHITGLLTGLTDLTQKANATRPRSAASRARRRQGMLDASMYTRRV